MKPLFVSYQYTDMENNISGFGDMVVSGMDFFVDSFAAIDKIREAVAEHLKLKKTSIVILTYQRMEIEA